MMVITQTCDIVKAATELSQVEVARVFATAGEKVVAQVQTFGSARYFRVNQPNEPDALILDYGQRALLDKGFLGAVTPDNTLVQGRAVVQRELLARWLGRRYDRPAIPDIDYEQITRPVRQAWAMLVDQEPETAAAYSRAYSEWRYRREKDGSVTLYALSPEPEPDELLALEVGDFLIGRSHPSLVLGGPVLAAALIDVAHAHPWPVEIDDGEPERDPRLPVFTVHVAVLVHEALRRSQRLFGDVLRDAAVPDA
jgi:hypothetical protein